MKKVLLPLAIMLLAAVLVAPVCADDLVIIPPLAMNNATLGGGALNQYTPGVEGGIGLNNIGLLVRTWGIVTAPPNLSEMCFYINDGSNLDDGSGNIGIRVSYKDLASGVTINPPSQGDFVSVTGISSTWLQTGTTDVYRPMLLPRNQDDITLN